MRKPVHPAVFLSPSQGIRPETDPRNSELLTILQEKLEVEVLCLEPKANGWRFFRSSKSNPAGLAQALKQRALPGKVLWIPDGADAETRRLIPWARALGYRVVVDKDEHEFMRNPLRSARRDRSERRDCKRSHAVVAASHLSASRLQKIAPKSAVHIIPHPIDFAAYAETRAQAGECLLFGGRLQSQASAEGLLWFLREVMPRLRNALGENLPRILVPVGISDHSPLVLRARRMLAFAGVELVEQSSKSLAEILPQARIVFVPARESAEARFPILEAMAAGRAVISTGQAAQGLTISPSYDLWIADQPDSFASGLFRLLSEADFRETLGAHAAEAVERNHGRTRVSALMDQLLLKLQETEPSLLPLV